MGAWAEGPFDNDMAADWAFGFGGADRAAGIRLIEVALDAAANIGPDSYLEADAGQEAVAAAELVAAMLGQSVERSAYNEVALDWLIRTKAAADDQLRTLAVRALGRVLASKSELAELWDETGTSIWRSATEARKASLGS